MAESFNEFGSSFAPSSESFLFQLRQVLQQEQIKVFLRQIADLEVGYAPRKGSREGTDSHPTEALAGASEPSHHASSSVATKAKIPITHANVDWSSLASFRTVFTSVRRVKGKNAFWVSRKAEEGGKGFSKSIPPSIKDDPAAVAAFLDLVPKAIGHMLSLHGKNDTYQDDTWPFLESGARLTEDLMAADPRYSTYVEACWLGCQRIRGESKGEIRVKKKGEQSSPTLSLFDDNGQTRLNFNFPPGTPFAKAEKLTHNVDTFVAYDPPNLPSPGLIPCPLPPLSSSTHTDSAKVKLAIAWAQWAVVQTGLEGTSDMDDKDWRVLLTRNIRKGKKDVGLANKQITIKGEGALFEFFKIKSSSRHMLVIKQRFFNAEASYDDRWRTGITLESETLQASARADLLESANRHYKDGRNMIRTLYWICVRVDMLRNIASEAGIFKDGHIGCEHALLDQRHACLSCTNSILCIDVGQGGISICRNCVMNSSQGRNDELDERLDLVHGDRAEEIWEKNRLINQRLVDIDFSAPKGSTLEYIWKSAAVKVIASNRRVAKLAPRAPHLRPCDLQAVADSLKLLADNSGEILDRGMGLGPLGQLRLRANDNPYMRPTIIRSTRAVFEDNVMYLYHPDHILPTFNLLANSMSTGSLLSARLFVEAVCWNQTSLKDLHELDASGTVSEAKERMERIHDVLHQATELQKVYPHFIDALVQKGRKRSHGMAEAGQALIEIGSGVGYPEIVL